MVVMSLPGRRATVQPARRIGDRRRIAFRGRRSGEIPCGGPAGAGDRHGGRGHHAGGALARASTTCAGSSWVLPDADLDLVAALARYPAGCAGLFAAPRCRPAHRRRPRRPARRRHLLVRRRPDVVGLLGLLDDRLRYLDGIDDAAFLAMDLEFHGRPDLAQQFLADYRSPAGDPAPASLGRLLHRLSGAGARQGGLHPGRAGHPRGPRTATSPRIAGAICARRSRGWFSSAADRNGQVDPVPALAEHVGRHGDFDRRRAVSWYAAGGRDSARRRGAPGLRAEKVPRSTREVLRRPGAALGQYR